MKTGIMRRAEAEKGAIAEPWGSLSWLASRKAGNAEGITLGRVVIRAGQANPRHRHMSGEEVLYLVAGRLEHTLGGEKVVLEAGDTLVIPAGVFHNATSTGGVDAEMVVAYPTGTRDFDPEKP
jgi:quercetin dioxygenase-like cupin family protein